MTDSKNDPLSRALDMVQRAPFSVGNGYVLTEDEHSALVKPLCAASDDVGEVDDSEPEESKATAKKSAQKRAKRAIPRSIVECNAPLKVKGIERSGILRRLYPAAE